MFFGKKLLENSFFWFIVLFALAALFRLPYLNLIEFKTDEALNFFLTYLALHYGQIQPIGIMSSTGFYNFPLFTYIITFVSIIFNTPQSLTFFIALLNTMLVPIFYLFVKRFYGNFVGVIASLCIALSPWSILFSRKIWQQDIILLFEIPLLFYLHKLIIDKDTKASFYLFLLGVLLAQIHGSGIFFFLIVIASLFITKTKFSFKKSFLGIILGMIPAIPYFFYQFLSGPFCRDCATFLTFQAGKAGFDLANLLRPFELFTIYPFSSELGNNYGQFLSSYPLLVVSILLSFISVVFLLSGSYYLYKNQKDLFLLFPLLFLPVIYIILRTPSAMHYYVILTPIVVIIVGLGVQNLYQFSKSKLNHVVILFGFSLILVSYLFFEVLFYNFLSQKQNIEGDYGPIFSLTDTVVHVNLKRYEMNPLYDDLTYFSYIFIFEPNYHEHLSQFFLAHQDKKDAAYEHALGLKLLK